MRCHRVIRKRAAVLLQAQETLAHLEEHLDAPALAVDADDFLRREAHVRCHQYQPVLPMVAIADKDKAHREGFFALDDSGFHTQQILRAATPLSVLLVDRLHILQASLLEVVYLFRLLCHGDHIVAKTVNLQERCRGAEPCVEQDVARRDIGSLRFLQELKHHLGCLLLGKFSLLAAIGTSVHFP